VDARIEGQRDGTGTIGAIRFGVATCEGAPNDPPGSTVDQRRTEDSRDDDDGPAIDLMIARCPAVQTT